MPIDEQLFQNGFELQAALEISSVEIALPLDADEYSQLLVFGHGGSQLWRSLPGPLSKDHPLDRVSIQWVKRFLSRVECPSYRIVYPSSSSHIDLRSLGKQLGWHADSPLGIGINARYGTWFAYRVVVLANTSFEVAEPTIIDSPCRSCVGQPCVSSCPVNATGETFNLTACSEERVREQSSCADQCPARNACPIGLEHKYGQEQMKYHYQSSLAMIQSIDLT